MISKISVLCSVRPSLSLRRVLALIAIVIASLVLVPSAVYAHDNPPKVFNVHIGGLMDPHNESLIRSTLKKAESQGAYLYIIQLDSNGIAGGDVESVAKLVRDAHVVTAIWVGPTSVAYSPELKPLVQAADFVGAASKTLARKSGASMVAPSLREFLAKLDNQQISRSNGVETTLDTGCSRQEIKAAQTGDECKSIGASAKDKFVLTVAIQFEKLSPISNLGHALISPGFAVGILVLGLCLLAFEFYAASIGVAAVSGILGAISGLYGLAYLPTHWWAIAIVAFGVFAMVVDVQAGGVGLYTIVGALSIAIGTFFATTRGGQYEVTIASTAIITIMALLFMVGAIPSLIRTRFGTPTIGREDFIGEEGIAKGDIDPEGSITLRGASWKARTNHATPIKDGEKCKVVKIEGIILEVEPLVGAAIDYREKRSKKTSD